MTVCAAIGTSGCCAKLPEIRNETRTTPSVLGTVNFTSARIFFALELLYAEEIMQQFSRIVETAEWQGCRLSKILLLVPSKSPYRKLTLSTQIGIDSYSLCDKITVREYSDSSRSGSESAAFFVVLVVTSAIKAKCPEMIFLQNPLPASLAF